MEEQNRVPEPTHIVFTYPSQNTEILFRACDGMMIGERQGCTVIWGESPAGSATDPKRKQSRVFMEGGKIEHHGQFFDWNDFGSRYMRGTVAIADLENCKDKRRMPILDIRCQEGSVILAPDSLEMRTNGGGMKAVNVTGRKFN